MTCAFEFAKKAHEGQLDKGGEPHYAHCERVALAVKMMGCSANMVNAAVLHDVLEDTKVTGDEIKELFGDEVLTFVSLLSRDPDVTHREYINQLQYWHEPAIIKIEDLKDNIRRGKGVVSDSLVKRWEDSLDILRNRYINLNALVEFNMVDILKDFKNRKDPDCFMDVDEQNEIHHYLDMLGEDGMQAITIQLMEEQCRHDIFKQAAYEFVAQWLGQRFCGLEMKK